MNLVVRDPFLKDFTALTNRFNHFFDLPRESNADYLGAWNPAVDIFDKGGEVVIHAELPGIKKEDIDDARRDQRFDHPGQERTLRRSQGRGLTTERSAPTADSPGTVNDSRARSMRPRSVPSTRTAFSRSPYPSPKKRSRVKSTSRLPNDVS